jgi:hypothetical protein
MILQRLAAAALKRCCHHVNNGGGIVAKRFMGRYSRMMDLGGAPSSMTSQTTAAAPNLNKNCHLQYILFDFQVLCRSMQEQKDQAIATNPVAALSGASAIAAPSSSVPEIAPVRPDVDRVLQVAQLLKVDMAGRKDRPLEDDFDDDLSLLTNTTDGDAPKRDRPTKQKPLAAVSSLGGTAAADMRLKYAEKLRQKTGGGGSVGTVDNAREELSSGKGGDADFHFAARQRAVQQSSSTTSTRWMAGTGTGQLLTYLHGRGFKVVLLPKPVVEQQDSPTPAHVAEAQSMDELVQQLQSKLSFHAVLHQDGTLTADRLFAPQTPNDHTPAVGWRADTTTTPDRCLCVSDRDIILKGAKETGMLTLRIRPPNARRGNVSTNYTVETVTETQTIVNEINGISFRTVLRQQGF